VLLRLVSLELSLLRAPSVIRRFPGVSPVRRLWLGEATPQRASAGAGRGRGCLLAVLYRTGLPGDVGRGQQGLLRGGGARDGAGDAGESLHTLTLVRALHSKESVMGKQAYESLSLVLSFSKYPSMSVVINRRNITLPP
jgi:hypothetical protein